MQRYFLFCTLALVGCDVDEGPKEEAREAVEAVRDGAPLEKVGEEVGDAADSTMKDLERRVTDAGAWVDARTAEIEAGGREVSEDLKERLDKLGKRVKEAQKDIQEASKDAGENLEQTIQDIEAEMKALFDDGDDQ